MSETVEGYGWKSSAAPYSYESITPRLLRVLHDLRVRRVCDVGSGNGVLAGALRAAGYHVVGVERDKEGVALSNQNHPGINFYNLGVEDDPATVISGEGALFDAVVSTEVVEHLFSPHLLPAFARPLLREGGYLVVSTPYHGYLKNVAVSVSGKWDAHHSCLWHGGHIKFWSRKTLTQLLETNGFRVTAFSGVGRLPLLWKWMILVAVVSSS